MSSIGTQLGAPGENAEVYGRFTDVRIYKCEAATTPQVVASDDLEGLQGYSIGDPDVELSAKVLQMGGGNKSRNVEIGYEWGVDLEFLPGEVQNQLAAIRGVTFNKSNDAFLPMVKQDDYPDVIIEALIRAQDNDEHLMSLIIPDAKIGSIPFSQTLESENITLPLKTQIAPGFLCADAAICYEQFTGDGSTTAFTLTNTPLNLTTASTWDHLYFDDFIYIKKKVSTASEGTIQTSGFSLSGTTLTATSAPASGTVVQVLYAYDITV